MNSKVSFDTQIYEYLCINIPILALNDTQMSLTVCNACETLAGLTDRRQWVHLMKNSITFRDLLFNIHGLIIKTHFIR